MRTFISFLFAFLWCTPLWAGAPGAFLAFKNLSGACSWPTGSVWYVQSDTTDGSTSIVDSIFSATPTNFGSIHHETGTAAAIAIGTSAIQFDGASYVSFPDSDNYTMGSGDFVIDGFFYISVGNKNETLISHVIDNNNWFKVGISNYGGGKYQFMCGELQSGSYAFLLPSASAGSTTTNTLHHFECSRTGNTAYLFLDGVLNANFSSDVTGVTLADKTSALYLGYGDYAVDDYWDGFVDDIIIKTGVGGHTGNFTPRTTSYTCD